jgi:hypothetical protein
MVSAQEADQYLRVVGRLLPPNCDDRTWLLVLASARANGLVPSVNWDSPQGRLMRELIGELWDDYQKWLAAEGVDPTDFPAGQPEVGGQ